ncbi:MAG: hypothetical protein CL910_13710 [Deltaproteobacteria bacterium]|nr:hypothetical protein [Deltaproteobacteria bacterium]
MPSVPDAAPPAPRPAVPAAVPTSAGARGLLDRLLRRRSAESPDSATEFNKRRIALLQPESYVAEQFRTLRARIDSIAATNPVRTLAVTSARGGEGKTMASLSLAIVSAMNVGSRVILVDCDLRLPTVHKSLGLRPDAGLAEVIAGDAQIDDAIQRLEGTELDVLPVRGIPSNPAELLASARMREILEELAGRYDRVVLDLPCTLGLPDAKTLSELCDGIVFVVRAGETSDQEVASALEVLDRRRVLGMVLNGSDEGHSYGPYHRG